ncbi:MAG: aminodeoxychorismate lyase [Flavobacteriaceae bacterium]|nr:aminodeoxychorismate lyase [Flavobacteriaceae bacterium]
MNKFFQRLLSIFIPIGIVLIIFFCIHLYNVFYIVNTNFDSENIKLYVKPNTNFVELKKQITPFVKSSYYFNIAADQKGYSSRVKSGLYVIPKKCNNNDIINILRGKSQAVKVTFNNHERLENLAGRVSKQIFLDSLSLINAFYDKTFILQHGFDSQNAISMYLPDTYEFFWDTSVVVFRQKMLESYNSFWNKDRIYKAKKIGLSKKDISILASIVQKESVMKDERPRIAGVYLNRLKKRMKLQADPTVIFALKDQNDNFDRKIRRVLYKDLKIKSPYNTYKYRGLPPGPICMPDLDAIDAVLNAENHKFLFFVADPQNRGYHLFGRNLKEHNFNKKKYIRWINKKKIYR